MALIPMAPISLPSSNPSSSPALPPPSTSSPSSPLLTTTTSSPSPSSKPPAYPYPLHSPCLLPLLISILARKRRPHEATYLLHTLKHLDCTSDVFAYNSLVIAFARVAAVVGEANRFFMEMKENEIVPDSVITLDVCGKSSRHRDATEVLREMEENDDDELGIELGGG